MADSSKDELVQLLKRLGEYLTIKISNLFSISPDNRSIRSTGVGVIAGLAIAIVFTWRLLRTPPTPRRRQPKRLSQRPSSSGVSHTAEGIVASGVNSSLEDSRAQNVIDEFFLPVKPTLGQVVRQKLSEGRKVTCRLLGVILEESHPEELQKQATVRSSVLEVLLEITKFCDLYLMERILDDESGVRAIFPTYWQSNIGVIALFHENIKMMQGVDILKRFFFLHDCLIVFKCTTTNFLEC
ncbi:peroxisome biogenesis protein 22-like isoform X2 [Telopea speciosissima]|uniref:peroxisome biogenesis protein 22-like isoform X2 n=1 Tax=Telopea speciosissima TaxID=54955 RepID=UPI001CC42CF7|nr:peroxisome biogenesis protein 22-like isoform X2 [Telopea speciosissima]